VLNNLAHGTRGRLHANPAHAAAIRGRHARGGLA
jgi:hypothetical protein